MYLESMLPQQIRGLTTLFLKFFTSPAQALHIKVPRRSQTLTDICPTRQIVPLFSRVPLAALQQKRGGGALLLQPPYFVTCTPDPNPL